MAGPDPACPTIAIIGGGFSGAAMAFHLARRGLRATVFEPKALGAGLAYGTDDPAHRLNARAQRMSMVPETQTHFCDWIAASGACQDDDAAVLPDGRIFPRRAVYGRYVAAQLAPFLKSGAVRHISARVETLRKENECWRVESAGQPAFAADIVILATGHAPPEAPARLAAALAGHEKFIADPTIPCATNRIGNNDRVLIVGTGLTMADVVASLTHHGHTGNITAVSRRGQAPRGHAAQEAAPFGEFANTRMEGSLALLRHVRTTVETAQQAGIRWQCVFDALRAQAQQIWQKLPAPEKRRMMRHLRPFWDVHRHRLPPQVAAALHRRMLDGTLDIKAASVADATRRDGAMRVGLRQRGTQNIAHQDFDAVIITTGPGPANRNDPNALIDQLITAGWLRPDPLGQGLQCDSQSRAINQNNHPTNNLLIAGPLARGHFGELMSVPEIALQLDGLAARLLADIVGHGIETPQARPGGFAPWTPSKG
jgi:uncharacterized NAD(P)/FAD-binding protein YdhS